MNKVALVPNLKGDSLKAICLVHDTILEKLIEITECIIMDKFLISCSHANNRYKMTLMDKDKESWEPEKARKRKALQEELTIVKKRKKKLEVTAQMLGESADKKAKEAKKKMDVATMKTLLIVIYFKKIISGDNEDRCSKTRRGNKRSVKETKSYH